MLFESPPANRYKKSKKNEGITRRDLLRAGTILGIAGALKLGYDWQEKDENSERTDQPISWRQENVIASNPMREAIEENLDITEERTYRVEDKEAVNHTVRLYSPDKVKLDGRKKEATEHYWYNKYKNDPKLARSLESAYIAMQPYVAELKVIFREEGVPAQFVYLAIPESHWNWTKDSPKGAAGPYQLMKKTARSMALRVDDMVDERYDIMKSARASAKILKEIYDKSGNWDLALSGYNGSFIWKYFNEQGTKNCSYEKFLKFIEVQVNDLKWWLNQKEWIHTVKEGESLSAIAAFYEKDWHQLAKYNQLKVAKDGNPIIQANKVIRIPLDNASIKKKIYENIVSGFIENLNYPGKFWAVIKILQEKGFQAKMQETISRRMSMEQE